MKNKKTYKVKNDNEINFDLIGISTSEPDYKICWQINQDLNFEFIRTDDLIVFNEKKNIEQSFALYKYMHEEINLIFISNKSENGLFLDELKMIDYFILVFENSDFINELKPKLKNIAGINGVFSIDASKLKAKHKLIFEIPE